MKFKVQPTPDFKPQEEADCSVLLKLKKGDEYKLVLNMQAYSPDKITVKLNGQELSILAAGADGTTDDFKQTHVVPEGIDLDQIRLRLILPILNYLIKIKTFYILK